MTARPRVKKIAICGFGLIGGCIALDLLKGRHSHEVIAYDRKQVLQKLRRDRRFDVVVQPKFSEAVANADIVVLAAMHDGIRQMLTRLSKLKKLTDCLIIDTGAVKMPTVNHVAGLSFGDGTQFMPSHPMAGREKSGFANADAGLFRDRAWYLAEEVALSDRNQARLDWLLKKTKAVPVYIDSATHDEVVSEISHLPQLLSTILGAQVNPSLVRLSGPGLKSMLRLAGSPHGVWSEIIDENREEIIRALRTYADNVETVTRMIENKESLAKIFRAAARSYTCSS